MKLEVINSNGIVESAFIKENDLSFSLFINTKRRWIDIDSTTSGGGFIEFWFYKEDSFLDSDVMEVDIVKLIAETESDKETLHRLRFKLHEKDQILILFPNKELLNYK